MEKKLSKFKLEDINSLWYKDYCDMELIDYSLKIDSKVLIKNLSISFEKNIVNHFLDSNSVGKL